MVMSTKMLRFKAGMMYRDGVRRTQYYLNRPNMVRRIVVAVIALQIVLYMFYHTGTGGMSINPLSGGNGNRYDTKILSTSAATRFNLNEVSLDLQSSSNAIKRFVDKYPTALENTLQENCMNFFQAVNNTEFYESLGGHNYHGEQYTSSFYDNVLKQVQADFDRQNKDKSLINDENDVLPLMESHSTDNIHFEANLLDMMTRVRIYGKCHLDNRMKFPQLNQYEAKLFPYLSGKLPIYENFEGKSVNFPVAGSAKKASGLPPSNSFLQNLLDMLNGRGIVMSIGEKLVDETCQLIKVLRYFNNPLSIQLVHSNELSSESKAKLVSAARDDTTQGRKQDLWFVDISPCLTPKFSSRFKGFNSKWIAILFSSFEEIILMDNDAVLFVPPTSFFTDYEKYNSTGTFFFRDRESFERVSEGTRTIVDKMLPKSAESVLFDVPNFDKEQLASKLNFFSYGAKHFMESGVVVLNKRKNLKGLLMATNIQLIGALANSFYGDKEIFWLGQVLAGNDDLFFNTNAAGNIGTIEEASKYSKVIKSIQPAHISPLDDHTLLWINSGLKNCKKDTAQEDFESIYKPKDDTKFQSAEDLKIYYNSPLNMQGVVIPPNSNKDWNNAIHEPSRGFHQIDGQGCGGYYWFAYSSVGTPDDPPELTNGKLIEFTDEERAHFKEVADAWFS